MKWPDGKPCARCRAKMPDPRAKWCPSCKTVVRSEQMAKCWEAFKKAGTRGAPTQPKLTYRGRPTKWAIANPDNARELAVLRGSSLEQFLVG